MPSAAPDVTTRNPLRRLFDQLFHLSRWNRRQKKAYEAQREMVEEATKLAGAVIDHQRTRDRLTNIQTLLDTDRSQRLRELVEAENQLNDALLENEATEKKKRIYETNKNLEVKQADLKKKYELKRQELEYKKRLHALEKEVATFTESEQPKTKKKKTQLHDQLLKEYERIDKEYLRAYL